MNNLIAIPMVLPLFIGIILVFLRPYVRIQRVLSIFVLIATSIVSIIILITIRMEGIIRLDFGDWSAPFGILFVADAFAMLLVLTTSIISVICLLYAVYSIGEAREKMYFYPFVLFLIAGVNGAFLTGDLFNLFVCFEVMLLSSYVLITLGATKQQLKVSVKYIAINILSSWIFLVAIAYTYGTLGTLNLAHLSERIAESGQTPLLTVISILFLIVFSIKSGLLLYQWLPGAYSAPPTAIAALFGALLTKVGIYALIRMFTLLFYHEPQITHTLIGIMAAITLIGGSIGAIAYTDIRHIVAYNVVVAVGFILVGLAIGTPTAMEGSIFYVVHDIIVKGLLFLLAGTMIALTGSAKIEDMSGLIRNYPMLGWLFFLTVLSLAGIPPLSGFLGKLLIGLSAIESGQYLLLAISFLSGMAVLYSLLRIFMSSFWGETIISTEEEKPLSRGLLVPCSLLAALTIMLGLGSEGIAVYVMDAANTLTDPQIYIDAVLYK
ncbi:Na+/H+ antiporter subunit D [Virgibacillus sp. W0181]|uniref:Na+/H+ antiporter subunit D n=1 Tax=Virgibacillus sp. W0181 TaxID=3391581 RepID=UPI003F48DED9